MKKSTGTKPMNRAQIATRIIFFVTLLGWILYAGIVRAGFPELTQQQVFLQSWRWLIPVIVAALVMALAEYNANR
jgi:NADH:ubiquinone oxidoreductase subunit H